MRLFSAIFVIAMVCLPLQAQEQKEQFTESQFRAAARSLFQDPTGPGSKEACKVIITWTTESLLVEVTIGPPVLGLMEKRNEDLEVRLICAFMAGQALAQRDHDVDSGYAEVGGQKVLEVYDKIRTQHSDYVNQGAKALKAADDEGRLEELLRKRD